MPKIGTFVYNTGFLIVDPPGGSQDNLDLRFRAECVKFNKVKMDNINKSPVISRHQALYKGGTPPWKETYRKV